MKKNKLPVGISQCMIVKDEERNIGRALAWGRGIVSEQIVVDTGSVDRTVELAKAAGARVFSYPWDGDFSAAKNYALNQARYSWIAFLDADEYMDREEASGLFEYVSALEDSQYGQILATLLNLEDNGSILAGGSQMRFFRNRPGLRYTRRIHEYVECRETSGCELVDAGEELHIYHTGYSNKERAHKKGRNLELIKRELKDHPDDRDLQAYLGDEYYSMDQCDKAVEVYGKLAEDMPDEPRDHNLRDSMTLVKDMSILGTRGKAGEEELLKIYAKARRTLPKDGDFDYALGRYYMAREEWDRARTHLSQALNLLETHGNAYKSMMLSGRLPETYELLAACCYNDGDLTGCVRYAAILLSQNRYLMSTLHLLLYTFRRGGEGAEAVLGFLMKYYDMTDRKDRLFLLKAVASVGYEGLEAMIRKSFSEEELACLDQAEKA